MNNEQLQELISLGHEQLGVEFKGHGSRRDRAFFALIALAMLGMANRRDGGDIIVGVQEDKGKTLIPEGLSAEEIGTWTYDDLADSMAEYADPSISFELNQVELDGKKLVIIKVNEFEDIPV